MSIDCQARSVFASRNQEKEHGTVMALVIVVIALIALTAILVAIKAESSSRSTTQAANATLTSSHGVLLTAGLNATNIRVGQKLSIAISLFNTVSRTNSIRTASDWSFGGLPVFVSPPCYFDPPLEFVVLKGHYTQGNLPYICAEGVNIDTQSFDQTTTTSP